MHVVRKVGWGLAKFVLINKIIVRSLSVQGGRGPNTPIIGRKYYKDSPQNFISLKILTSVNSIKMNNDGLFACGNPENSNTTQSLGSL